jgi:thioredoxin-related protein
MKNIFLSILLSILVVSLSAYGDSKKSVRENSKIEKSKLKEAVKPNTQKLELVWLDDVQAAFTLAKKEKKSVLVMVEDPNCRWCVKMKEGALSDERVQKHLQEYVLLKIERSDKSSMESLPGLRGPIPSFHFFTADKKFIDKLAGYYKTEDFLGYIKEIAEDGF